ncbi:MAG: hypothetical protein Q6L50_04965 [Gloeomargarita sp. GMQP_bins_120]
MLQIHQGQYLVRVVVQVGGITLATGLGSGNTLEGAEDRARERALMALGLTPKVAETPHPVLPSTEPQPAPPPVATPVAEATSPPESPKVDMLDILAQTTAEMKRLGWTNAQGREYLRRTYGRNSRQELTDQELIDFLNYLRSQPSGNGASPTIS